jgi:hypothetical protein
MLNWMILFWHQWYGKVSGVLVAFGGLALFYYELQLKRDDWEKRKREKQVSLMKQKIISKMKTGAQGQYSGNFIAEEGEDQSIVNEAWAKIQSERSQPQNNSRWRY